MVAFFAMATVSHEDRRPTPSLEQAGTKAFAEQLAEGFGIAATKAIARQQAKGVTVHRIVNGVIEVVPTVKPET